METRIVGCDGCRLSHLLLLLLVSVLFMVVDSEAMFYNNITRGSMISTSSPNLGTYWLSPSSNFAFGIYPVKSGTHNNHVPQYVVGIWLINSSQKAPALVWSLHHTYSPLNGTDLSILFDRDGIFKLQIDGSETQPLFRNMIRSAAQYASMQNNGNFAVYDSDDKIIWQSFDYPTDTILPGQVVKSGCNLFSESSEKYMLIMEKDENLVIYDAYGKYKNDVWRSRRTDKTGQTQLRLDYYGNLDIAEHSGLVIENLYKGTNHTQEQGQEPPLYRATLGSDGVLRLRRDTFGSGDRKNKQPSVVLWRTSTPPPQDPLLWRVLMRMCLTLLLLLATILSTAGCVMIFCILILFFL